MKTIEQILQVHKLRHTDCRIEVLKTFIRKMYALSHSDLEDALGKKFDRVTLYRTLKTFSEKGVIHKVLDDEGTPKYALCSAHCTIVHSHNHVHFKCESCGHTQCIEELSIPTMQLPLGFKAKEANLLIQGLCNRCNTL
ncbi:MAG: transcriptional repressor [Thermonemataceae bacterium]|nr:transcriptional repressor [Thermonemataceae bacterium]